MDPYHNILRMNMYRFDGSPLPAMYLSFKPPQMLPTSTLNPTATATGAKSTASTKSSSKVKRALGLEIDVKTPLDYAILQEKYGAWANADRWWWIGLTATGVGSLLYLYF